MALVQLNLPSRPLHPNELPSAEVPGLYVHIPFCFHKCHYCDFYSITQQTDGRMTRFVDLLLAEALMWSGEKTTPRVVPVPGTVFFGGGTPSLLPPDQMRRLIAGLRERLDFSRNIEWTVEVNPATANLEYCQMLREMGVNRLSFGGQSFNRDELKVLERHHDPDDVPRSIEIARNAGFSRLNVDLIYAIPGQSLESWMKSLEATISLNIPHISCYALTYEPNTPMAVKKRMGIFDPATDELELEMFHATRLRLREANIQPYEISNYAVTDEECRHNLLYWTGGSYVGLGPSAASHVEGTRFKNRPHLGEWEQAVESGVLPATEVETLSPKQRAGELMMLGLRLASGVSLAEFTRRTGYDVYSLYPAQIEQLSRNRLIWIEDGVVRLTDGGLNVADAVASEFLLPS